MSGDGRVIVITGSTRGIGYGLAEAFLARGCRVVVSGRTRASVEHAVGELARVHGERVVGQPCAVHEASELQALWDAAVRAFGRVDVWINNAGKCNAIKPLIDVDSTELADVIDTNVRGTMLGSQIALRGFVKQGHGQLFNMEGWGSRGERKPWMTPYSATKLALRYFTDGLASEVAKEAPAVRIGTLGPGMVLTDALVESYVNGDAQSWTSWRWLFNLIIDPREQVCGWLADRVLANRRTRVHYAWMTTWRAMLRFFQPKYWRRNAVAGTALDTLGREGRS